MSVTPRGGLNLFNGSRVAKISCDRPLRVETGMVAGSAGMG